MNNDLPVKQWTTYHSKEWELLTELGYITYAVGTDNTALMIDPKRLGD